MIPPSSTNTLFVSSKLQRRKIFFEQLSNWAAKRKIELHLLENTKDIWCRDYMPVQLKKNLFVQFQYTPSYLNKYPKLRTNPNDVTAKLNLKIIESPLIVDGGNVICNHNTVIMTEKVFSENKKRFTKRQVIYQLKKVFDTDRIIFIPVEAGDTFGHADGMIRFVNSSRVLISLTPSVNSKAVVEIVKRIEKFGLRFVPLVCKQSDRKNSFGDYHATGNYVNFLEIGNHILLPQFGIAEDKEMLRQIKYIFRKREISTIDCRRLAHGGGVLNCCTWSIKN